METHNRLGDETTAINHTYLCSSHVRLKPSFDGCRNSSPIPVCESSATGREVNSAPPEQRPRLLRGREIPNRTHAAHESRELLEISQGVLGLAYDVQEHVRAAGRQEVSACTVSTRVSLQRLCGQFTCVLHIVSCSCPHISQR